MDDLISRQAVLEATSAKLKITGKENAETVYGYIKKLCDDIKALPSAQTADAVEVVRCRDCKHWVKDGNDSYGYAMFCKADCSLGGQGIKKPDDFCSYGERKTDG